MNSGQARLKEVLLAGQAFRKRQEAAETGVNQSATIEPPIEILELPVTDPFDGKKVLLTTRLDRVKTGLIELYSQATLNKDPRAYIRIEYPPDKAANDIMLKDLHFTMYKVSNGKAAPYSVGLQNHGIPSLRLLTLVRKVVRERQAEPPPPPPLPPPPPPAKPKSAKPKSAWRPRSPFRGK